MPRYQPGDIVSRRKGLVMHKGIVTRDGRVLHNTPFKGEHICSEAEFRAGKRLWVERLERSERDHALNHADAHNARGYNLLTNNCEHTVNRAISGRAHSPQLRSWVVGVGVATLAFAITRHPGVAAAGYALGRRISKRISQRYAATNLDRAV
ncbi:MAG: hypothetical protein O7B25_13720 [Gammaproteobacteria bacterium]|nr:hypothetical protein [Gammaproteobacteria bacterium]